jgi:hypothetical protein
MNYPHVPAHHQALLDEWEAILRDEPDPNRPCAWDGRPIGYRKNDGPRRIYCSTRCRVAAHRARQEAAPEEPSDWMPQATGLELLDHAEADGADYIDAFPGDHPPLNAPVVPREGEPNSEFGWAWEIIGAGV